MVDRWFLIAIALLCCAGCGTSRWAMDDHDYATKYGKPYGDDKIPRMAKQIVDARHVRGKGGGYVAAAAQGDPLSVGGQIGGFAYPAPWLSGRVALAGVAGTGAENTFAGLDMGLRCQPPTRMAPFAGVGTFVGFHSRDREEDHWGNPIETDDEYDAIAAVYPELGFHFWLNGRTRLTASGCYYLTTEGRDDDFWFIGLGIGILASRDDGHDDTHSPAKAAELLRTHRPWTQDY